MDINVPGPVTLTGVSPATMQAIFTGLQELPFKVANGPIMELVQLLKQAAQPVAQAPDVDP